MAFRPASPRHGPIVGPDPAPMSLAAAGRFIKAASRRLGRQGVAAVEFAFCAPMLVILTLGCADLMTALRAQMRIETAAVQLGQIVSQCLRITDGDVTNFFTHGQLMVGSVGDVTSGPLANGSIVITAVRNTNGVNQVAWQRRRGAIAAPAYTSTVHNNSANNNAASASGSLATIGNNNSFIVPTGQTLFVTEVFLSRDALLLRGNFALPQTLRSNTLFLARAPDPVALQAAPSSSTTADCTA